MGTEGAALNGFKRATQLTEFMWCDDAVGTKLVKVSASLRRHSLI